MKSFRLSFDLKSDPEKFIPGKTTLAESFAQAEEKGNKYIAESGMDYVLTRIELQEEVL